MSIFEGKGCQKLKLEEIRIGIRQELLLVQHIQILKEEDMLIKVFANIVFYFTGKATVHIPYSLMNSQLVVLVHSTHSNGRDLKIGTSIP